LALPLAVNSAIFPDWQTATGFWQKGGKLPFGACVLPENKVL
jgi:hypothetical protein